ncbi:MAG: NAD(P)/FAD-dependent oxidoreductase, partial [Clostridia bacterium]|nr:NAD(P)/FAD-dependent oxidoreductase [Clostridia bacterium]
MDIMKNKEIEGVTIIGGGAAGLMAAIAAARRGTRVTILEKNPRVGKKILATGNGRCNYTNMDIDISRYHGMNPKFALSALKSFDNQMTIQFFRDLGIYPRAEGMGKIYPRSNQASSILDVLRFEIHSLGVETRCDTEIVDIKSHNGYFKVLDKGGNTYSAKKIIIAPGGKAAPSLGANGGGYPLAKKLGHKIVEPFPSLTKLKLKSNFLKQLQGIKIEGTAEILRDNKSIAREKGEILFTNYGVSGPPILQLSRRAGELLRSGHQPILKIIVVDDMNEEELREHIVHRLEQQAPKPSDLFLVGFLNKQLARAVLKASGIENIKKTAGQINSEERHRLIKLLQNWSFAVTDLLPWSQAHVTAGGVDTSKVNPQTMESEITPGLYFAGEILDIDGDSGGFNLQ